MSNLDVKNRVAPVLPPDRGRSNPQLWQLVGWSVFTFLVCVHFTLCYDALPDYLNLNQYTLGSAPTPYQYRLLPMLLFRAMAPRPVIAKIAQHAPVQFRDPHQIVQMGFVLLSALGSVFATSGTLYKLTADRKFSRWFSLLVIYMAYFNLAPGWGLAYSFPYDAPSLFFFCLGVYLVVSERTWLYYLMFPLAVVNRETIGYLTIFFLIWKWRELKDRFNTLPGRSILVLTLHALAQAAIYIGIKTYIGHMYAGNPTDGGGRVSSLLFRQKLLFNLHELIKPQQWPVLLSSFGFLLPFLWMERRRINQPGIAWSCAVIVPLWFLGMMLVGIVTEIRVFSELSAFLVPALALIVYHRFGPRRVEYEEADLRRDLAEI